MRPALAHDALGHERQPLLEVGVGRADDDEIRVAPGELGGRVELTRHAHQRILGWLVPVRGRVEGRPLGVGVVVGAPGGRAQQGHPGVGQALEQRVGLGEIRCEPVRSRPEGRMRAGLRPPHSVLARAEGVQVEDRETHPDRELRGRALHRGDRAQQEARPSFEVPAVGPRALVGREQLVPQVAVARLHVDEAEARVAGHDGHPRVLLDQVVELGVAQQRRVVGDADATIQHRMAKRGPRRRRALGPRIAARVGELQPGQQVVVAAAVGFVVRTQQQRVELREVRRALGIAAELVRVGAPVGRDGIGLAAPHELCAARPEALPTSPHEIRRTTVGGRVPALHRKHREAVADRLPADVERRGQRPPRLHLLFEGHLDAELGEALEQRFAGARTGQLACLAQPRASRRRAMSASTGRSLSGRSGARGWVRELSMRPRRCRKIAASCL